MQVFFSQNCHHNWNILKNYLLKIAQHTHTTAIKRVSSSTILTHSNQSIVLRQLAPMQQITNSYFCS